MPVVHATASPDIATPASVRLVSLSAVERDFSATLRRAGLVVCGNWHSEPRCDDLPTPSEPERLSWAEGLEDSGAEVFAGLIYAGDELHAFAARRDSGGCTVVEPAVVQHV